ncbi:MAG: hypothetical protein HQ579_06305 [Candidatus Omnitrophica bacterium]|nr:hypothetical protein [Candidatus Omnitrophota bacterium]
MKNLLKVSLLALLAINIFSSRFSFTEEDLSLPSDNKWENIHSDYFIIYYRPDAGLKRIEKRLEIRRFFTESDPDPLFSLQKRVAYRMDALYGRVREILQMYPKDVNAKIRIFKNRKELDKEYYRIFREKKSLKSFYIYRFNTIYLNEEDISDSVVAHEMGHAVVDHYFAVRPSEKIREILSQYVDIHLDDEF